MPFFTLGSLETVDLSNNKLSKIGSDLFVFDYQPSRLQKVSLAFNRIQDIASDAFKDLTLLTELDLSNNYIKTLTTEPFANLTNLEKLRLDYNNIIDLNGAVNDLQNLKHLYLRGNRIENIDEASLKIINHLETFDVSWNYIEEVKPMMLSRHWQHMGGHSICKINLSDNKITSVPNATSKVISTRFARHLPRSPPIKILTELDLSMNEISNIEYNAFQSLVKLDSLDLSSNKIVYFIVNGNDIAYVRFLNLSNNQISNLYYESFSRMNNLQNLDMSHNRFDNIPEDTFHNNNNLKLVNMTFNALERLDDLHIDMFHHQGGILDLSNNNLTQLKINPGQGKRLAHLILHSNKITDPSLIDLRYQSDLKYLDMSRNMIRELDSKSLRLPVVLSYLDLHCNIIEYIAPSTFSKISHLKTLHLSHNKLKYLEYGMFSGLSSLLSLDLSFNMLGVVDSKMLMDLKSLAVLSLQYNHMHVLKDESWYGHRYDLRVYLEGNNFTCEWLGSALKNYNNGYTKMHPAVQSSTTYDHSLDGIPCVPGESEALIEYPSQITDERLLITSQKILEAVREQTSLLKNALYLNNWRPMHEEGQKIKVIV